jgi:hypothetical protein
MGKSLSHKKLLYREVRMKGKMKCLGYGLFFFLYRMKTPTANSAAVKPMIGGASGNGMSGGQVKEPLAG